MRVNPGEIVGLLGPNGSGKSTLLRCSAGLVTPTTGTVRALGVDPALPGSDVRGRIGFVIRDDRAFNQRLSGRQNLKLFAFLQRIPARRHDDIIDAAMREAMLADVSDKPYRMYSSGMKQRLSFARAMLLTPGLLLMDEATTGFDPGLRDTFHERLRARITRDGIGALYATHDMDEAEHLCDRLVVVDGGRVVARGSWDDVRDIALDVFRRAALKAST